MIISQININNGEDLIKENNCFMILILIKTNTLLYLKVILFLYLNNTI